MADIMKILQQAQEMQGRLQQIQEELQQKTVTAAAGGGMVTVEADGKGQIRKIKIDPSVVDPSDVSMLEDLIAVAVRDAQAKAAVVAGAAKIQLLAPEAISVGGAQIDSQQQMGMRALQLEPGMPIEPGSIRTTAEVTVRFSFSP